MNKDKATQTSYSPDIKRSRGISPLWLLPILTLMLAGWLVFKAIHDAGQSIQIHFREAQGLVAGRTPIRYQGLEVGMVRDINLSEDLDSIYVDADVYPEATQLLSKGTRFWLVKPKASLSGISGLDALVTGNYIAIQPSAKEEEPETVFTALERAPSDIMPKQGLNITLKSSDLGGVTIGSQIVYKKIPIGEVFNYQLDSDAKAVLIQATIQQEYSRLITDESRFWNVSGVGASLGFQGVDVKVDSLSSLIGGAIAVDSPDGGEQVGDNAIFKLYPDLKTAGRGIPIKITLPDDSGISRSGAPLMYRGIEIGQITDLQLSDSRKDIIASAAIQPAFSDMLTSGTRFILQEAKVSLSGVENISNLVTGNYLTLVPGKGDRSRYFTAYRKNEIDRQLARSIVVQLTADNSYGLDAGANVLYRGITVGSVSHVELDNDRVRFDVLVDSKYAHLIRTQNRYFVTGSASAELTESGLNVTVPPAKQLLTGSISFTSEGEPSTKREYTLYANQSLAELAKYNRTGSYKLALFARELPPVSKGSPLLYHNLQVGKIDDFRLVNQGVLITATIENQYQHLITPQTVFWNRSGVEIDASLSGISVTASPLKTLIRGGIAFDSMPGTENKQGEYWKLYSDLKSARRFGQKITLTAQGETNISNGTPIKYNGVKVGEVTQVTPDFEHDQVLFEAHILPDYAKTIARKGSYFWQQPPQVSLSGGVKNLSGIFAQAIHVEPGDGQAQQDFALGDSAFKQQGVSYTLQSERRGSVTKGTPIYYRDIEVGHVTDVELGDFADRVNTTISIEPKYTYLIRRNTVFWNTSGVDISIGLSGADIKAGTLDSIVRGGITFATPEEKTLLPAANPGASFLLYPEAKPEWKSWRTAIPKP
ncbi:PqiB family protein [Vibrio olivae]|uniref:MlaD family protein n=1 Tax=Vibrio olivae TaxID=1243002 RepID=A0ABV5HIZ1_9VIBR